MTRASGLEKAALRGQQKHAVALGRFQFVRERQIEAGQQRSGEGSGEGGPKLAQPLAPDGERRVQVVELGHSDSNAKAGEIQRWPLRGRLRFLEETVTDPREGQVRSVELVVTRDHN